MFVLVASGVRSRADIERCIKAIVVGGAVVAFCAIIETRTQYNVFNHLRTVFPFLTGHGRARHRGSQRRAARRGLRPAPDRARRRALALPAPVARADGARARHGAARVLHGACALVLVIGMVATISRTAFLALAVMLLVGLMTERRRLTRLWPLTIVLLIAAHTVLPGGLGASTTRSSPRVASRPSSPVRAGGVGSGRLADIHPALKLVQSHAFFGTGDPLPPPPDLAEKPAETVDAAPPDPIIFDDQYLTSLVGHGVFGLGAVLWLVGAMVFPLVRASRRARGSLPLLSACTASVAGFAAAMLTFDAFAFVQCSIFFFVIAALGLRLAQISGLDGKIPARVTPTADAALLAPALVAAGPGVHGRLASLPLADGDVLAGLEVLVDLEEVLDLGEQLGPHVVGVRDARPGRVVVRHAQDLLVPAGLVVHLEDADGTHGTRQPGNVGDVDEQQRVERIAVLPERLQQEAVIARVDHARVERPVEHDALQPRVVLVLVAAALRDLDERDRQVGRSGFHARESVSASLPRKRSRAAASSSRARRRTVSPRRRATP